MKRRVLITGGAGFIGSHIVDLLLGHNYDVTIVDNFSTGKEENINHGARVYECDIRSFKLHDIIGKERPQYVIHHAAHIDVNNSLINPTFDGDVNVLGSLNLLEASRLHGVEKVIYASSAAGYGDPLYLPIDEEHPVLATSPYGISKNTVENYLAMYRRLYGMNYTVLRYANVYGPRQNSLGEGGVVAVFVDRILSKQTCIVFGDGNQTRDFVYVGDVARANLLAIDHGDDVIINVSCQRETSINDLVEIMRATVSSNIEVDFAADRPGEIRNSILMNERAKEILGWQPEYDVTSGIRKVFEFQSVDASR